jgi:RimJ/RimL family protein N-acetyltransferase
MLRRFTPDDVDAVLALDGDPAVMRYIDRRIKSRAQIEAEVLPRFLAAYERYRDYGHFAAETRDHGEFIGWLGLRPVVPAAGSVDDWDDAPEPARIAALGYRLRRSAWGRGYGTEGARALVRRAFVDLAVEEIVATTMAVNAGSRAVLEKAGLRYARTVHLNWPEPLPGNEHGDVEYRLRRAEWRPPPDPGAPPGPD